MCGVDNGGRDTQSDHGANKNVRRGRRNRGAAQIAMLASVPKQLIGANWTLAGRRDGLAIAAADDGEWIARNRVAANDRRDA